MSQRPLHDDESLATLLMQLVDTKSVSRRERAIADLIAARLTELGSGELTRIRRSVIWRGPQRGRPLVVLAGHVDTVRSQRNAFATRAGDQVSGLGSSDMKGGVAVMLALLDSLDPEACRFDLAFVFYDCEEGPSVKNGLKRVMRREPWLREARLAVVLEPTDLRVELGCVGSVNLDVRVPGVSAHAARPWTGVNAVRAGASWLARVTQVPTRTVRVEGLEFHDTLEITRLRAGSARNVLPGEMIVNLNHRFPPGRTVEEATAWVRSQVPEEFECKVRSCSPPGAVCAGDQLVKEFIALTGAEVAGKQGWTDVARFTDHGVPAFNYGPGLAEMCHRADEYASIANLGVAYRHLLRWLNQG